MSRRFVLLDRDGTINVEERGGYVLRPDEIVLLPGALEGLRAMRDLGLHLVVVTNQSPIGRGWIDTDVLKSIHCRMLAMLEDGGVAIDRIYVCPHLPGEGCACRKPEPGLALRAAGELGFSLDEAFVVGDKDSDVEMGRRVGATTVLVSKGQDAEADAGIRADHVAADLREAAAIIRSILAEERA